MNQILYRVRKDAIDKFRKSKEEDRQPLFDAAISMMDLSYITFHEAARSMTYPGRIDGCKEFLKIVLVEDGPEYLRFLMLLAAEEADLDDLIQRGAGEYWIQNPQGIWAMVFYIYLWGMVMIWDEYNPRCLEDMFNIWLQEEDWPKGESASFQFSWEEAKEIKEKVIEKEQAREQDDFNQRIEGLFSVHPVFQNPELIERLHELEEEITEKLSDQSIENVLHSMSGCKIGRCLYGLSDEAGQRMLQCDRDVFSRKVVTDLEYLRASEEEELLGAVLIMLGKIKRMRRQNQREGRWPSHERLQTTIRDNERERKKVI